MAVVVQCPECKAKMSVGEGRVGEEVICPGCKVPFTAAAVAGSRTRDKPAKRRRSGRKVSDNTRGFILTAMIVGTLVTFLVFVRFAVKSKERPEIKPGGTPDLGRPLVRENADSPRKSGTPSGEGGGENKSTPGGTEPSAADRVLADVLNLAGQLEKTEPATTAKALAAIPDERERAEAMMKEAAESPTGMTEYGPKLSKWGLTDWLTVTSAKHAREDADFRAAVGAFAAAGMTPRELLGVLGRWYLIDDTDRKTIGAAAQEGWATSRLTTQTWNAVVSLGARKWLER